MILEDTEIAIDKAETSRASFALFVLSCVRRDAQCALPTEIVTSSTVPRSTYLAVAEIVPSHMTAWICIDGTGGGAAQ